MCGKTYVYCLFLIMVLWHQHVIAISGENDEPRLILQSGHEAPILSVSISPDTHYALAAGEQKISLWHLVTGRLLKTFQIQNSIVTSVAFMPDGQHFISGGWDKTLQLWDLNSGRVLRTFSGHSQRVTSLDVSHDGKYVVSGSLDNEIIVWSVDTGTAVQTLKLDTWEKAHGVAFSPDSEHIFVGTGQGEVYLFDVVKGKKQWKKKHIENDHKITMRGKVRSTRVKAVLFSMDGRLVISAGFDGRIQIRDAATGELLRQIKSHDGSIISLVLSPDGNDLFTGGDNQEIRRWEIASGRMLAHYKTLQDAIQGLAISRDGRYILSGAEDESLMLWDTKTPEPIRVLRDYTGSIQKVALSADGNYLATARTLRYQGNVNYSIHIWDLTLGKMLRSFEGKHASQISQLAFTPDGQSLFAASGDHISEWETNTGKLIKEISLNNPRPNYSQMAISADSSWFFVQENLTRSKNTVYRWDLQNARHDQLANKDIGSLSSISSIDIVAALAVSPNQRYLAIGGKTRSFRHGSSLYVKLMDVQSKKIERTITNKGDEVISLAFSPDNKTVFMAKHIYSGQGHSEIVFWDISLPLSSLISTGHTSLAELKADVYREKHTIIQHDTWFTSMSISPDGRHILTGDVQNRLMLWDITTGKVVMSFHGHTSPVTSTTFSADGSMIVSGDAKGAVKLWHSNSAQEIATLVTIEQTEYVALTAESYYRASKNALSGIAFSFAGQTYGFDQFDLRFNRPDKVLKELGKAPQDLIEKSYRLYQKRLEKIGFSEEALGNLYAIPEIKLLSEPPFATESRTLKFAVEASDKTFPLNRINVWVNGVPQYGMQGIDVSHKRSRVVNTDLEIDLGNGNNHVQVSVLNQKGAESFKHSFIVSYIGKKAIPDLYLLAIGISDYVSNQFDLAYADKDAQDLAQTFLASKGKSYGKVHVLELLNSKATQQNILQAKQFLAQSQPDDNVVVFFAGHGLLDSQLDYYFATSNMDFNLPHKTGVSYGQMESLMDGIASRQKLLLIDTCHAGELDKESFSSALAELQTTDIKVRNFTAPRGLGRIFAKQNYTSYFLEDMFIDLRRRTGSKVIAASAGASYSIEGSQWKNGVFTYTIIDGLKNMFADQNEDGFIYVDELSRYTMEKVRDYTKGQQTPVSRSENPGFDFPLFKK